MRIMDVVESPVLEPTVPERSVLHKFVHGRLREIFGQPDNSLGRDDDWSLRPDGAIPLQHQHSGERHGGESSGVDLRSAFPPRRCVSCNGQE